MQCTDVTDDMGYLFLDDIDAQLRLSEISVVIGYKYTCRGEINILYHQPST